MKDARISDYVTGFSSKSGEPLCKQCYTELVKGLKTEIDQMEKLWDEYQSNLQKVEYDINTFDEEAA